MYTLQNFTIIAMIFLYSTTIGFLGDTMLTPAQEKRIKKIQEENLKLLEMFNDFPYVSNPLWKTTIEEGSYMHRVNSVGLGYIHVFQYHSQTRIMIQ